MYKTLHQTNALLGVECVRRAFAFPQKDKRGSKGINMCLNCLLQCLGNVLITMGFSDVTRITPH